MADKEIRVSHHAGVGKPEASWNDLVTVVEVVTDESMDTFLKIRSIGTATARVTGEFMRDAVQPLDAAASILTDALSEKHDC